MIIEGWDTTNGTSHRSVGTSLTLEIRFYSNLLEYYATPVACAGANQQLYHQATIANGICLKAGLGNFNNWAARLALLLSTSFWTYPIMPSMVVNTWQLCLNHCMLIRSTIQPSNNDFRIQVSYLTNWAMLIKIIALRSTDWPFDPLHHYILLRAIRVETIKFRSGSNPGWKWKQPKQYYLEEGDTSRYLSQHDLSLLSANDIWSDQLLSEKWLRS